MFRCQFSLSDVHTRRSGQLRGELTLRIHVESLLTSRWVRPDNGVLIDDRLSPLDATAGDGSVDLLDSRVGSLQSVQTLLKKRAEALVSLHGIHEESVAASVRAV